jgi:hypothetical protein
MAFKFQDLIVTIDSCGSSKKLEWCGSSKPHPTGGCGSTPDYEVACLDSGEVVTQEPYALIEPHYQQELRQLLIYALTMSKVKVARPTQLKVLIEQMTPRKLEDIEGLERRLSAALKELGELKRKARAAGRGTRGR